MKRPVWTQKDVCRGPLILVNAAHPLPAERPPHLSPALPEQENVLLESRAAKSLAACVKASGAQEQIRAVSGWRSRAEQRQLWNDSLRENGEAFTRSYVALPGCSEHETGLAIDLAAEASEIDFIRPDFPRDGVFAVFRRLAPSFGWIERYTAEKEEITGIAAEPWHFRYVGTPHASILSSLGICLEEYLASFKQGNGIRFPCGEGIFRIFRIACRPNGVTLPLALPYEVSGDNDGGFLVTVREGSA